MSEPGLFDFIFDYVERDSFTKYFRLVVIVCGYALFKGVYQKWATKYHVKQQVERDKEHKAIEKQMKEDEAVQAKIKLEEEAKSFGWGKKTRKTNKAKEAFLEQQATELRQRHQTAYDAAEDHDIDDLLED